MNGSDRHEGPEQRLARLPMDVPPGRDLWPDIEARIKAEGRGGVTPTTARRRGWLPLAAASLAAAAVALGSLYLGQRSGPMDHSPVAVNGSSPAPFGPGHDLGARHQAARAGLTEGLERRLAALPPETRATVEQNLDTIRRAAAEINAALGDDPANLFLQHQLLSVYQDELNVLGNIQRVTEPLSTRNDI
jgi:hypothetical protein